MNSILGEISTLRKGAPLVIDYKNSNRYRLVAIEPNGTKTAYYFTSPIYNSRTRKAVDMKFHSKGGVAYATGSNANITVGSNIRMENSEGSCVISLAEHISRISETEIVWAKTLKPILQYRIQTQNRSSPLLSIQGMNTRTNILMTICTTISMICVCRVSISSAVSAIASTRLATTNRFKLFSKKKVNYDTHCQG